MSSVTPIRPRRLTEEQVIADLADDLTRERLYGLGKDTRLAHQDVLIEALQRSNAWLSRRAQKRRQRELAMYLFGVTVTAIALGATYLLTSYDIAQLANRALVAVGL